MVGQAKGLLGCFITTTTLAGVVKARIIETEAYRGADDKACHAYLYKKTSRTAVFYEEAGTSYIYLCYGIHNMLNVVCGPESEPNAILIRAVEIVNGLELALKRRKLDKLSRKVAGGPGLVCQALGIDRSFNGLDMFSDGSPLALSGLFNSLSAKQIIASPRVGIAYAEECANWPWRFRESGNLMVSPAK